MYLPLLRSVVVSDVFSWGCEGGNRCTFLPDHSRKYPDLASDEKAHKLSLGCPSKCITARY